MYYTRTRDGYCSYQARRNLFLCEESDGNAARKSAIMFIPITDIDIGDRIREDYGSDPEWKDFKASFPKFGQLQAVKVQPNGDGKYKLVSGGRRHRAVTELYAEGLAIPGLPPGMLEATVSDETPLRVKMMREF